MLKIFKYVMYFFLFITLILSYFLFTSSGKKHINNILGYTLSKKAGLNINVRAIDLSSYPTIHMILHIEHKAKLTLWGNVNTEILDINYTLSSDCVATEHCEIDDDIEINGHISGDFDRLVIEGKGLALEGNVSYSGIKYKDQAKNVHLKMDNINSPKLLKLLGQEAFIQGKANAVLYFEHIGKTHKKGYFDYVVKKANLKEIPLNLHTKLHFNDNQHTFDITLTSPTLNLDISKGIYHQKQKKASAFYTLDIQDLSKLEKLLGYAYQGKFYGMGEISYHNTELKVTGLSKSFGGMTEYLFEKDKLHLNLQNVLLQDILYLIDVPRLLTAKTTGKMLYNLSNQKLTANTTLNHARFTPSSLVNIIHKKSDVNLLKESFNHSSLQLTYQNNILLGDLKLSNPRSNITLTNTTIDTKKNMIDAYFDVKSQKQEFSGKVFGSLDNPEINLNMQKLIRYQMDKQVDKIIGKNGRKMMEKMPMGGVAKDMASDMGASFINIFF